MDSLPPNLFDPRSLETTTEVYSRDWRGGKGPAVPGIGVNAHDYVDLSYDGDGNITVVKYFVGGADGILVSQLELTWEGTLLKSVKRLNLLVSDAPS